MEAPGQLPSLPSPKSGAETWQVWGTSLHMSHSTVIIGAQKKC